MRTLLNCITIVSLAALLMPNRAQAQVGDYPYCQIVDRIDDPIWHVDAGVVITEDVDAPDAGDFGIMELLAGSGVAYLPTSVGTFDIRAELETWFFTDSGGIDLPDQVGMLWLDAMWTGRLPDGLSVRAGVQPGIYSDLEDVSGQDFFVPFKFAVIQAFSDQLSGLLGLRIYPGFDRVVDPDIGFRWVLWETWKFDLFYPESRVVFAPTDLWKGYLGFRTRQWPQFEMEREDERDSLLYNEDRLYAGVSYALFMSAQLVVEVGKTMNREVDFEPRGEDGDVEDALFFRVGLTGLL